MTAFAEVIGDPIGHSLSPVIHGFWLEALGIEAEYRRCRITRAGLPAYLAKRRVDRDWLGCNVTMPLKLDAAALADEAADEAVAAGAANLLTIRHDRLVAGNTDVGAIAALLERFERSEAAMRSVTLLGNGGAARAALVALRMRGISAVRIQARDMSEALKLAVEFDLEVSPVPLTEPIVSDGLINATPLGMAGRDCLNCNLERMPADGWVFDMVTDPAETPLLTAARERGLSVATGLEMLVEQAAASFRILFGVEPPRDRDDILWQKLRQ